MEKDAPQNIPGSVRPSSIDRRRFVGVVGTAALGFTIVPRHVLGGKNYVAPSDKITLAYIGLGTQGIRELLPLLAVPQFQVIAVCDPNKQAIGYKDWSKDEIRNNIRNAIRNPNWDPGGDNSIPGGRDNGKSIVDSFYANVRPELRYGGCRAYADVRELLEKEKDLDAVKIMTPDHLHGVIAMAAMKRGKHVLVHKPLSNRLLEGKRVIEMARKSKVITHLIPWDSNGSMETVMAWINSGAIGTLQAVHNWTNRPVWPQYPTLPSDTPPVPDGLDWDLWLGPEAYRPYHPNYTNMVFRGWYDFGGGSMADMGHYSLWTVFNALQLGSPTVIEPQLSHVCGMHDPVPFQIRNDFSFPMASTVRFKYPAKGSRPPVDLCWYDGGMRPPIPAELLNEGKELPAEGMMFVGDKGKILAGFNVENPVLFSENKAGMQEGPKTERPNQVERGAAALQLFIDACKSGKQYPGNFSEAEQLTEAVNLYAVALRCGRLLTFDAVNSKITNQPEANKYLDREYRAGWDPSSI
ncbi:MAG: Gfo/Idh/MocA family oxidoreductase [Bacteroidota bacterium]|nr:Gfo/Idh/MocA family oxidoreductase [Bacteroidota bacterium]MDP4218526.1 Gfo/Idh/MocA family oxidoreductase [Bacteroidota bacterium]MDP4244686.1 Gfo/Idh/MocA family oxidoreductase [Bacteroidota bacterium]MDP4256148.1 Gfo/Idh/MocA family oxidoreductase [Bacteroidota bacterium]MDP4256881.1 Gfo/Idh/MocA family oxidoreductase [Bacteroidota bacterium]